MNCKIILNTQQQSDIFKIYRYVSIGWSSKQPNLTVGWLFSETIRALQHQKDFNPLLIAQITVLKNTNVKASECYDYMLTQVDGQVSLAFIKNGDSLQVLCNLYLM